MLNRILRELGWYKYPDNQYVARVKNGTFEISDGSIVQSEFLQEGDYFRVVGSKYNDDLFQHPKAGLTDEIFDGAVWVMRIPPDVITLAREIEEYMASDAARPSAYTSESFGGYSYTRATNANGAPISWKNVFADDLRRWKLL